MAKLLARDSDVKRPPRKGRAATAGVDREQIEADAAVGFAG